LKAGPWSFFRVDPRRMLCISAAVGSAAGAAFWEGTKAALGNASIELGVIVGVICAYFVLSAPRRLFDSYALSQSRGAMALAASGTATLEATHSRSRALLLLISEEPAVGLALAEAKRRILLGVSPGEAVRLAVGPVASYSTRNVLTAITTLDPGRTAESGEEAEGMLANSQLSEESKLPLFMAVAFFTPLMLTLYMVFTRQVSPLSMAELVAAQLALVDLAFYFCSGERPQP
jgi:hypothetical protein